MQSSVAETASPKFGAAFDAKWVVIGISLVVVAIGIGGPSQRLTLKKLRGLAPGLLSTAEAISSQLGYRA